jgi:iron complex outermembrane recepter protein
MPAMHTHNKIMLSPFAGDAILRPRAVKTMTAMLRQWLRNREGMRSMNSNQKLSYAITAILSGSAPGFVHAAAVADTGTNVDAIQEIVVTAQRRTENSQNVPITIQALTADTLQKLSVETFDDFVKYLPNVTSAGYGPGQNLIFIRGLSTGALGTQGSGTDANFPNVAVYLDDQSAQLPYRNLDIYAADIERVEILEGPQGTLFGAGAEAGAVRYITNKPKLDVTEGNVNAGYGYTTHGDPNTNVDATLNVPIVPGTLAVRAVIYDDNRGGYINNVPGTFTRKNTDLGHYYFGGTVPPGSPVISNTSQVANAINPVTYQGVRASLLWKINDNWNVLLAQTYQTLNAQGVFYQEPFSTDGVPLPRLSVSTFNPSYDKDSFENTAWTVNGQIGDLKAVYTGGYLVRHVEQQQDYTAYSRGNFAEFYQCTVSDVPKYQQYGVQGPTYSCGSPSAYWRDTQRNTHLNNEIRVSTPDDWRVRGIVGAFYEDFKVYDNTDWFYKTLPNCTYTGEPSCIGDLATPPGATSNSPGVRPDGESFFDDVQRGYKQYAFFGSADFDIIPKILTITGGTRYYHFDNTETGSDVSGFGCQNVAGPCTNGADALDPKHLETTYHGFKSRGNLTWHVTPDAIIYYTYSQGFRPGGFNRDSKAELKVGGVAQYFTPQAFTPDNLVNNEIGWKTEWLDHGLQFNGAVYREEWSNVQLQFFDPASLGNLSFVANGANYQVKGVETQLVWRVTHGLTLQGSASWNSTEQTNSPYLINNNPLSPTFGNPILTIPNPYGVQGSSLAQSPPFEANLRARYEWSFNDYQAFVQIGGQHIAHSLSVTGNVPAIAAIGATHQAFDQPGYTTYDASIGIAKDNWNVSVVGQNITDTLGLTFISAAEAIETQTVTRPRTIGLKFGYKF